MMVFYTIGDGTVAATYHSINSEVQKLSLATFFTIIFWNPRYYYFFGPAPSSRGNLYPTHNLPGLQVL